jgi:hypothetical protein
MMNDQERRLLQDFLEQLVQVRGITKDPEAIAMIEQAVARQPDAAYLLVQRSLLQERALEAAKAQIASLQSRLQAGGQERAGTFLDAANSWGNSARAPVSAPAYANPPAPPAYVAPRPSFMQGMTGGGGSFLGNMAATAAGVVGGAFLFQGIENLLSHHGGSDSAQHGLAALDDQGGSQQFADLGSDNNDLASDAGIDDIGFDSGADSGDSDSDSY